jgi:hypothetical protein
LKKYPTAEQFVKKYSPSKGEIYAFLEYCADKGVVPKEGDMDISGDEIRKYFKGLIIRSVYNFNSFIEFINSDDKEILKAVEEIKAL